VSRWIVRNAVQTPECGNGVWTRHLTWSGARHSRWRILTFRHGSGHYAIPSGGLVVVRSSQAFPPLAAQPEAGEK
jgi:hypothetical protein